MSLIFKFNSFSGKKFTWKCSRNSKPLNVLDFQNYIRNIYIEQEYFAKINNKYDKFQVLWSVFSEFILNDPGLNSQNVKITR